MESIARPCFCYAHNDLQKHYFLLLNRNNYISEVHFLIQYINISLRYDR